jgi:hypothetical protein
MDPWQKDTEMDTLNRLYAEAANSINSKLPNKNYNGGESGKMNVSDPINKILYGPPGTGKTYNVIYETLSIVNPGLESDLIANPKRRSEAVELFNRYVDSNQVMFCTFHQSYGYEEFVEGIRISEGDQRYEVRDGVFKKICDAARAVTSGRKQSYEFNPDDTRFFKMSLGNTLKGNDDVYDYCISHNVIALGWGEDVDYSRCNDKESIRKLYFSKYPNENKFGVDAMERFKHWMQVGDLVIISSGNTKARAIGKITGEYLYSADTPLNYYQFRSVEWLYIDDTASLPVQSVLKNKIFSQQTIYMINNDDINMESIRQLISNKVSGHEQQFVLIIDEINRGNISKIFGELITLIEPDKRLGQSNEIPVILPYSGDRLRVPSNVHILGTMNTADRSIALLDTALRRRFEFVEMMPNYEVLPDNVDGISIRRMLEVMNQRIEYLYDRDHVMGHAYFIMDSPTIEKYIGVMRKKVIPLLQEYFYDDWVQIERVLGGAGKPGKQDYLLNKVEMKADTLFAGKKGLSEPLKFRYTIQPKPLPDALKRIYVAIQEDEVEQDVEE